MQVEIASANDGQRIPACTPSLMPFHISYTGPAPVSRYFRPKPAPPSLAALSVRSSSSATLVASSSSTSIPSETNSRSSLTAVSSMTSIENLAPENERGDNASSVATSAISVDHQVAQTTASGPVMDAKMMVDSESQPSLDAVPPNDASASTSTTMPAARNVERFVAAFRGRQVYGQAVDIPSGFGGLVLRAPSDLKGRGSKDADKVKPRSKIRAAMRRSRRATMDDIADEPEGGGDGDSDGDPPPPTRTLVPLSTFSSFMLWTPDRPLDEGSDEYVKVLAEWTRLSAEMHSYDE